MNQNVFLPHAVGCSNEICVLTYIKNIVNKFWHHHSSHRHRYRQFYCNYLFMNLSIFSCIKGQTSNRRHCHDYRRPLINISGEVYVSYRRYQEVISCYSLLLQSEQTYEGEMFTARKVHQSILSWRICKIQPKFYPPHVSSRRPVPNMRTYKTWENYILFPIYIFHSLCLQNVMFTQLLN